MTATITFDQLIAQTEATQATAKRIREQEAAKAVAERQAERRLNAARNFGHRYEAAAVRRLASWPKSLSVGQIKAAQAFVAAMLSPRDAELPQIDTKLANTLKSMFTYGLELAERDGAPVPAGTFNGQRKLAEEKAAKPIQPKRLVIHQGDPRRRVDGETVFVTSTPKVELPPAITKPGGKKVKKG